MTLVASAAIYILHKQTDASEFHETYTAQCSVYLEEGYPNLNLSPCEGIFLKFWVWAPLGSGTTWTRSWSTTCTVQRCTGVHRVCTKCTFPPTFLFVELETWNLVWMLEFEFYKLSYKPYFERTEVQWCTVVHSGAQWCTVVHRSAQGAQSAHFPQLFCLLR